MSTVIRNRRNRNRGKQHEREVAKRLGGERLGLRGGVDVDAGRWAVECKSTSSMPAYMRKYYDQAVRHAKPHQVPIVVIHEKNKGYDHDFVVIRMDDWIKHVVPLLKGEDNVTEG